jgi:membrane protein
MTRPRASFTSDATLIIATVLATLAVHRHLSNASARPSSRLEAETSDHGRQAVNPLQIPLRGWKDILFRTYQQINEDRLLATAAGVVFYGLLALFPAITALVSSYGLFADPSTISDHLQSLALMMPEGSFAIVQDQVNRVLAKNNSSLGMAFAVGLLIAIWSANAGMKAILDALNVVYEEKEKRGVIKLNLVSLSFTIASLAAVLLMVGGVVAVPLILARIGLGTSIEAVVGIGRWPFLTLVLLTALAILYRYGPSRTRARWQWLSVGAIAASVLWLLGSSALSLYLSDFANYTATYGSLGAVIGLMTWMWMSAVVVLCGAELNSEIERQGATFSSEKPAPVRVEGARIYDGHPST